MNREIKFRAWDGSRFVYLSDLSIGLHKGKKIKPYASFFTDTFNGTVSLRKHELQQYTGLKDQFDKEIYEGDIVEIYDKEDKILKNVIIIWDDAYAKFDFRHTFNTLNFMTCTECIIKGNIFENKEL